MGRAMRARGLVLLFLLIAGLAFAAARPRGVSPPRASSGDPIARESLRRAAAWLWSKQDRDGGWHSETYGFMRSGQSLTPHALLALLDVPEDVHRRPRGGVERALEFMRRHTDERGCLGMADPDVADYPTYATAGALRCFARAAPGRLVDHSTFLGSVQLTEQNGFSPDHPGYGAFSFGARLPRPEDTGHVDLPHTRRALQALSPLLLDRAAERFLRRLQNEDGGFYLSTVVLAANKAGDRRSYATPTCDGILALLACGAPPDDRRVLAARAWLERHPRLDDVPGIPEDHPEPWDRALFHYHLAVRAEVYEALDWPGPWRAEIGRILAARQRRDGSFRNDDSPLQKEDDPLVATALAITALARAAR